MIKRKLPVFENQLTLCGSIEIEASGSKQIHVKENFPLVLDPEKDPQPHECLLVKLPEEWKLYKVLNKDQKIEIGEEDRQDLVEIDQFKEIPLPSKVHSLRIISILDHILILLIDDAQFMCFDIHKSWSKDAFRFSLQAATNVRMNKVAPMQFIVQAMQFKLYEVIIKKSCDKDGNLATSIRIKQVKEILAWDYASHMKTCYVLHEKKRTELCQAVSGKTAGFHHLEIQWKTREVRKLEHYCEGSKVFDVSKFPSRAIDKRTSGPPKTDLIDEEDERSVLAFVNAMGVSNLQFVLIDLKRRTQMRVFQLYEAMKVLSMDSIYDPSQYEHMPLAILGELYVGLRVVSVETQQIHNRLRLNMPGAKHKAAKDDVNSSQQITLLQQSYPEGVKMLISAKSQLFLFCLETDYHSL